MGHFSLPLPTRVVRSGVWRYAPVVTVGDPRSGASCPSCGARLSAPSAACGRCPDDLDSDPTWPEAVEQPAIAGTALSALSRQERFRRTVRGLDITVHRAGPTLSITVELQRNRAATVELPVEIGVTLLERSGRFGGIPDTFIRVERPAEPVICSVPARGLHPGDPAVLVLTQGDVLEEIQTLVR